jgi:hypothetical protein
MKWIVIAASSVIAIVALWIILLWVPEWMANQYYFKDPKDWAGQVVANRAMLVNLLGGFAVAVTIFFTYRNFKVAQDTVKLTENRLITETFSKAIEQLGNADMSVRLGGIHSLARIARSSQKDYFPVMQVLTGFLRTKYRAPIDQQVDATTSPGFSNCPVEVQTILTIVGERYWPNPQGYELDLSYVHVCNAWVPDAKFQDTYFWDASLTHCNLSGTKLNGADLKGAVLKECNLTDADLRSANLQGAVILNPKGLTKGQLDTAQNVSPSLYDAI